MKKIRNCAYIFTLVYVHVTFLQDLQTDFNMVVSSNIYIYYMYIHNDRHVEIDRDERKTRFVYTRAREVDKAQ